MRVSRALVLTAAVMTMGGCQTLTEELPSQPTSGGPQGPQTPIIPPIVIPVPIPTPETPSAPVVPPSESLPPPSGGGGGGGDPSGQIPDNTLPVAKVGAKVYFLECNGQQVPGSEFATEAQVGCRIHFDCTPKDAFNNPTQSQGLPNWTFTPGNLVAVGNPNDFTPTVTATNPGGLTAYVEIDGVTSNSLSIQIYN